MSLKKGKLGIFCCIMWDTRMSPVSVRDISKVHLVIQDKVLSVEELELGDIKWHGKKDPNVLIVKYGDSFFSQRD